MGHFQKITSFKDLLIWQKGIEITRQIYLVTSKLPKDEQFGLTSQMRRCSISIPSNIAEGRGRNSRKDFIQFLHIAQGSLYELETQLIIINEMYKINTSELPALLQEEGKMISSMIKKLKQN